MRDFDRNFSRMMKLALVIGSIVTALTVMVWIAVGALMYSAATNPEAVGNHVGQFVNGVTSQLE